MINEKLFRSPMRIPLSKPEILPEDIAAVGRVLDGTQLSMGPATTAFENRIATVVGRQHAVAVNSGTSALHLAIRAMDIGPGDEVITTPFSFIASTNCILFEQATPVFVDIDPITLCIDPDQIEAAITPKTVAILAVDVFGHPADWKRLEAIAARHDLLLLEDAAESLGSYVGDAPCGSFGHASIFGFYPNKQITTGEGGMLTTDDAALANACRSMANQGRGDGGWLSHVRLGYSYRLDEMSSALGLSQLERIERIVSRRSDVASWYLEDLKGIDEIVVPAVVENVRMSWFVFVVRLASSFTRSDRDRTLYLLQECGIGCRDYFQPIHLQPFIQDALGTARGQFPVTEAVSDRTIALPFFTEMTREQVGVVIESLSSVVAR